MSIRTRIAGGYLAMLAVAFLLLALSFNFIVEKYIESQVDQQMSIVREKTDRSVLGHKNRLLGNDDFAAIMPQVDRIARRSTFLTQVEVLVLDEDYQLIYPRHILDPVKLPADAVDEDAEVDEYANRRNVYEILMETRHLPRPGRMLSISGQGRTYYLSKVVVPIGSDVIRELRLVMFMDMTDITRLARSLNLVLMIIILIAVIIAAGVTFWLSNRISKPIRELSDFAEAMGRNDFTPRLIDCRDRELVELSEVMNRSAVQLDTYDKEQKAFFQNVSHELRTPLMSIRGYAEGIEVGVFEDDKQGAKVIIQEADLLAKMVEELLYLSKMDNITDQSAIALIDVRETLSSCSEALRGVVLHEGKALSFDFSEVPVMVNGAEKPLERAFSNLIINALRYAKHEVTLGCKAIGDVAVISVLDDGDGIDEQDMPKIFDRFYKGKKGKHGIGLSIVKAVVAQHGGKVAAENTEHGALFKVELPISNDIQM